MSQESTASRPLSYREMLLALQGLCREKRSGVMVITNESGGVAKLGIDQGEITDVSFRGVTGKPALLAIKQIKSGLIYFYKASSSPSSAKHFELSTQEILKILSQVGYQAPPAPGRPPAPPADEVVLSEQAASSPDQVTPTTVTTTISRPVIEECITLIQLYLLTFIGPVGRVIFQDYRKALQSADSIESVENVIEHISQQCLYTAQQKTFKQYVQTAVALLQKNANISGSTSRHEPLLDVKALLLFVTKHAIKGDSGMGLLTRLVSHMQGMDNIARVIPLPDILRFIEKTNKTIRLDIIEGSKKGSFFFSEGMLINATEGSRTGVNVAFDLLNRRPDFITFGTFTQNSIAHEIRVNSDMIIREASRSISHMKSASTFQSDSSIQSSEAVQDALHKEIERLQQKKLLTEEEYLTQAIQFITNGDYYTSQSLLCDMLMTYDHNYNGWLWLSRVLQHMTAIEFTLKKAAVLSPKSSDVAEDVKKFTLARKTITREFVLRCPFCWMPVVESETECPYCQSVFFLESGLISKIGNAKAAVLDQAIECYGRTSSEEGNQQNSLYLYFYLGMAYLNRKYYHAGITQFSHLVRMAPHIHALHQQNQLLLGYMKSAGLLTEPVNTSTTTSEKHAIRILVVEDSLVTRKVIVRTLTANGYEVVEAKDADEALVNIENTKLDLILLDIILPGRDGYEVLSEIRNKPALTKIPVIMLTSRDSLFDKIKGRLSDADEYLTKPFQPDQLLTAVKKHLKYHV